MSYAVVRRIPRFTGLIGFGELPPQPTIRLGSTGTPVSDLQHALGLAGNGVFDATTLAAVKAFQSKYGLTVDGVVGPKTWKELEIRTTYGMLREQQTILANDPSQGMSEEAKANYAKAMYASLPAPVQAPPPDASAVMAAQQAAILAADPSQGMSEEAKANYAKAMNAALPAPVGPSPSPAPMQANTPVPIVPSQQADVTPVDLTQGSDPMLTQSATPPSYALPAGAKSLVQIGGAKTWWASQSTGMKVVVVGGGAVAVLGVLSLFGGSSQATPNRRRKGR